MYKYMYMYINARLKYISYIPNSIIYICLLALVILFKGYINFIILNKSNLQTFILLIR